MTNLEKKRFPWVGLVLLILFTAGSVVALVFTDKLFGEGSVFHRAVSENSVLQTLYGKIPALIRTVQIITFSVLIKLAIDLFMKVAFAKTKRGVTVTKLLSSFIKWIVGIVAVLMILSAWGVNTTAIIASAGILSLVVGLGAQSLVADIIAGLFIVVEGEYQVGDIVVIEGWRGTVTEIGIRTTKIQDAGGNVKIINNSEIKSVVNQTQALSVARATIAIEYGESLERVELVIRDNLEAIREHIPGVLEGPFYKGVTTLAASGVELLFLASCREEDIFQVQRELNRELKLLFDAHHITIPFPQVVVNQPTVREEIQDTPVSPSDARAFIEEQKESSRGVEEKPEE